MMCENDNVARHLARCSQIRVPIPLNRPMAHGLRTGYDV
jgi:hypothetical protein